MVAARATRYTFAWMFEMFTEQSRQAVVLAQEEARALNHGYIGTEHVLLGLLRQEEGLAVRALRSLDITADRVRAQVVRIVGQGEDVPGRQVPFTPHTKRVLELALREALAFGHNYVGTEHILIGLVREHGGMAARILLDFDADAEKVRNRIAGMLSGRGERGPGARADSGDLPDVKRLSDDELDEATDRAVDQLVGEERGFFSRCRALHDRIDILRAERDRRRRDAR